MLSPVEIIISNMLKTKTIIQSGYSFQFTFLIRPIFFNFKWNRVFLFLNIKFTISSLQLRSYHA